MERPYCPNACQINVELFLKNNPAITEMGVNVVTCPLCERKMKITTRDILDFTCEKVEKLSRWKKFKNAFWRERDWIRTRFGI